MPAQRAERSELGELGLFREPCRAAGRVAERRAGRRELTGMSRENRGVRDADVGGDREHAGLRLRRYAGVAAASTPPEAEQTTPRPRRPVRSR
jgi:hypothetical protein